MKGKTVLAVAALCAGAAFAQQGGRDSFVQQQAYAEMQRVSGQVDVLQSNIDDIMGRLSRLERAVASSETEALKSRIAALEGTVANLRRDLQNQRGEIVKDLSSRIAKIPQPAAPAPAPKPAAQAAVGPYREYVVANGDNLWLIARAFETTVAKIREMNGLKSDALKVGQTLKVPAGK